MVKITINNNNKFFFIVILELMFIKFKKYK